MKLLIHQSGLTAVLPITLLANYFLWDDLANDLHCEDLIFVRFYEDRFGFLLG